MDEARMRDVVDAHAQAVVRGDMDAVVADLSEELQPQADEIGRTLPMPVTDADVLSPLGGDRRQPPHRARGAGRRLSFGTRTGSNL